MRREDEMQRQIKRGDGTQDGGVSQAVRIFEALSAVDEELLERSEVQEKVVPFWRYAKVLAACICFVMVGVVAVTGIGLISTKENAAYDSAAPAEMIMEEAAAEAEIDQNAEAGEAEYANENEAAVEEAPAEEVIDFDEKLQSSMTENSPVEGEAADISEEQKDEIVCGVGTTESMKETMEFLSEKELRAMETLSDYIPTELPEGYGFESGHRSIAEDASDSIYLLWSKGMDSIQISVRKYEASAEDVSRLVDVSKPATYNVHLYEIPYADTVPEEYRTIFHNPIFAESAFSLEIVEARMKRVSDQGDTDTPRGNFAVLYDSGVLVEFRGRGDAESIWAMFQSIKE